jgi:hypothetical protein
MADIVNKIAEDVDRIQDMEREDTREKLPIGWLILFIGLIIFGIYYSFSFTPEITGWSQEKEYTESIKK